MAKNEDLFRNAIELSGDDRKRFLDSLSETQRAEVSRMMNAAAGAADRMGAPTPPVPDIDSVPEQLGPFKILEPLGEGGMGQVFAAEQQSPVKRRVALKVIRSEVPSKQVLARFEAERQALAMMDHQNIAKVLDAGITDDGRPFFAMELVKGIPITDYCDQNKLNPTERLQLFVQACRAIQHAHQKGIIHRDIKPSNVLATLYDGRPTTKVIDFGLAKALHDHAQLTDRTLYTQHGQIVGTLEYMSPEQAERNALDVDTRTDVFSLGVILYELMTGSTPIGRERLKSETMDRILVAIREEDPPRMSTRLSQSGETLTDVSARRGTEPRRLTKLLKGDLEWIAAKALEKDRTRRYDGAGELADDVERYLNKEAIEAHPPSLGYRIRKAYRRHKVAFVTAAIILGLLIAGLIGTGTMWLRAAAAETDALAARNEERDARLDVERERDKVSAERDRAQAAEEQALRTGDALEAALAGSNYTLAIARWDAKRPREAMEYLNRVPDQFRDLAWRLARRQFVGSDVTCHGHTNSVTSVTHSPDGRHVISAGSDRSIRFWDPVSGSETRQIETSHEGSIESIAISPDSSLLVSAGADDKLILYDAETGDEVRRFEGHTELINSVRFNRSGTKLVSGSRDGTARIWDVQTGEELQRFSIQVRPRNFMADAAFSPDESVVATAEWGFVASIWDVKTGKKLQTLNHAGLVTGVAFHPGGSLLATSCYDGSIRLFETKTGAIVKSLKQPGSLLSCVQFSPDGMRIASGSTDGTVRVWKVRSAEIFRTHQGHQRPVRSVCFHPNGWSIASGSDDRTVRFWRPESDSNDRTLGQAYAPLGSCDLSPDNKWVVTSGNDRPIEIREVVSGDVVRSFPSASKVGRAVLFTADGKKLVYAADDFSIRIVDAVTGRQLRSLEGHKKVVRRISIGNHGKQLVSLSEDDTARVWDLQTGELVMKVSARGLASSVAMSPLAPLFAVHEYQRPTVSIYDTESRQKVKTLSGSGIVELCLNFSPDGKLLASGGTSKKVFVWDVESGKRIAVFSGHTGNVRDVRFTHNGKTVVSGGADATIRLWSIESGLELRAIKAHESRINSVVVSTDGQFMLSTGGNERLKLWAAPTDTETRVLRTDSDYVIAAAVSSDGQYAASAESDRTIRLWDVQTGKCIRFLEGFRNRVRAIEFTPDGKYLAVRSDTRECCWDVSTGKQQPIPDQQRRLLWNNDEPSRWWAVPDGASLKIVDRHFRLKPEEAAFRTSKAKPDLSFYQYFADEASEKADWFGGAVNSARLLINQPPDRSAYDLLKNFFLTRIRPEEQPHLPAIVSEALDLPAPKLTRKAAMSVNNAVWFHVETRRRKPDASLVEQIEEVCRFYPESMFLNTLGVVRFRMQEYEQAIAACEKAISIRSNSPIDFAVLAMSHAKLGRAESAEEFRERFQSAVARLDNKTDDEVLRYVAEVEKVFAKK